MPSGAEPSKKKEEEDVVTVVGWGSNIASRVNTFMDQQRLERLMQCQEIQQVLKHCQERQNNLIANSSNNSNEQVVVEEEWNVDKTVPGTRMMRYFGWHEEEESPSTLSFSTMLQNNLHPSNDPIIETDSFQPKETTTPTSTLIPSCAKESHALWGCRAVSLGCGGHLRHLRECFQTTPHDVLLDPNTAYEPSSNHNRDRIPCQELQEALGKCVIKEAKELNQRLHPSNAENDK